MTGAGRRTASLAVATVAAATALVLLVAVWAATSGPDDPFRGDGTGAARDDTTQPPQRTAPPPTVEPTSGEDGTASPLFTIVAFTVIGFVVLLLLGCLLTVAYAAWGDHRMRRRRVAENREVADAEPLGDPVGAVAGAMLSDAAEQEQLLGEGSPRNGIVQCWHRFEVQAASADLPRHGWETSSEFTLRLLDLVEADASAVAELATLFREARFSRHELGEADRAVALEALQRIHRDLHTLLTGGVR